MQLLASWGYEGVSNWNKTKTPGLDLLKVKLKVFLILAVIKEFLIWDGMKCWECSHKILEGISKNTDFYFVHSYVFVPSDKSHVIAFSNYSSPITAIIAKDHIWGVQFHPEKALERD